jgi:hypothetical protein
MVTPSISSLYIGNSHGNSSPLCDRLQVLLCGEGEKKPTTVPSRSGCPLCKRHAKPKQSGPQRRAHWIQARASIARLLLARDRWLPRTRDKCDIGRVAVTYQTQASSFGFVCYVGYESLATEKHASKLVKLMPIAMMVSGVGLFLIGAAAFLHDCRSILAGGSCGSTTVESFLAEFNLFYYDGNAGEIVNNLMLLPFSYVLFGMGTAAFILGGLGSLRGR